MWVEVWVLGLQINDELAHIGRQLARIVGWKHRLFRKQADHASRFKEVGFSLQRSFSSVSFPGSFRCALVEKDHRAKLFIELLLRPEGILLNFLPVMRSFATRTVDSGHHRHLAG